MEAAPSRLKGWLTELLPGLDGETVVVLLVATVCLMAGDYEGSTGFWHRTAKEWFTDRGPFWNAGAHFWWFSASVVLYLAIPVTVALLLGRPKLGTLGFGLGDWRLGLTISGLFLAVMLPVVAIAAQFPAFQSQYPMSKEALASAPVFLCYEFAYAAYFVAWEFIYRGWLLQGLARKVGGGTAILIQTLPFALMHTGKPEAEAYGSVIAGVALGVLSLRTGSFWYGAALHAVIATFMDLVAGWSRLPAW